MEITPEIVQAALARETNACLDEPEDPAIREWTRRLLGSVADIGEQAELCVDPCCDYWRQISPRRGEFLWDLTLSRWPRYDQNRNRYEYPQYFQQAAVPKLVLVAESEWGDNRSPLANGLKVLEDFSKLLTARAPLKLMIFGYHDSGRGADSTYDALVGHMKGLISRSDDDARYVLFGVSWQGGARDRFLTQIT